jgi:UDP-2,4-diacetamido-2,4,6-trideoxy-beta-L-altropyranose hydrolase
MIRADAAPEIGTGHVMRCLALAQAWQDSGGSCTFLATDLPAALAHRLLAEGTEVQRVAAEPGSAPDATQTACLACAVSADWVVVDGYRFGSDFQRALRDAGHRVLAIDDYGHCEHYSADLVLNQNAHADARLYCHREPSTVLLLGTDYVLLRREFLTYRDRNRPVSVLGRKVLVTMGGADPDNITERVVRALNHLDVEGLETLVVVGASNPHRQIIESAMVQSGLRGELLINVTDMAKLMAWADAAVTAGGTSVWELALLGVPALGIGRAHQEIELLRFAASRGIVIDLGSYLDVAPCLIAERLAGLLENSKERARLAEAARRLVDGLGAERVVRAMLSQRPRSAGHAPGVCD